MNGCKAMTWLVFEHDSAIQLLSQFHASLPRKWLLCPKWFRSESRAANMISQIVVASTGGISQFSSTEMQMNVVGIPTLSYRSTVVWKGNFRPINLTDFCSSITWIWRNWTLLDFMILRNKTFQTTVQGKKISAWGSNTSYFGIQLSIAIDHHVLCGFKKGPLSSHAFLSLVFPFVIHWSDVTRIFQDLNSERSKQVTSRLARKICVIS